MWYNWQLAGKITHITIYAKFRMLFVTFFLFKYENLVLTLDNNIFLWGCSQLFFWKVKTPLGAFSKMKKETKQKQKQNFWEQKRTQKEKEKKKKCPRPFPGS